MRFPWAIDFAMRFSAISWPLPYLPALLPNVVQAPVLEGRIRTQFRMDLRGVAGFTVARLGHGKLSNLPPVESAAASLRTLLLWQLIIIIIIIIGVIRYKDILNNRLCSSIYMGGERSSNSTKHLVARYTRPRPLWVAVALLIRLG